MDVFFDFICKYVIRLNLQNANIFFNKIKVIIVIICIISSENLIAYKEKKMWCNILFYLYIWNVNKQHFQTINNNL